MQLVISLYCVPGSRIRPHTCGVSLVAYSHQLLCIFKATVSSASLLI